MTSLLRPLKRRQQSDIAFSLIHLKSADSGWSEIPLKWFIRARYKLFGILGKFDTMPQLFEF